MSGGSPPTRVVWIEIHSKENHTQYKLSPPTRVVWIEIEFTAVSVTKRRLSPPTRVVWIEIGICLFTTNKNWVTTHTGGVDWNPIDVHIDRAVKSHHPHGWCGLKLLLNNIQKKKQESPPTRVVWIEIRYGYACRWQGSVTTHTGGVDWNKVRKHYQTLWKMSPPTRVVWIEIAVQIDEKQTESRHHPHGWCGLKSYRLPSLNFVSGHHPHGWCGLKLFLNRLER